MPRGLEVEGTDDDAAALGAFPHVFGVGGALLVVPVRQLVGRRVQPQPTCAREQQSGDRGEGSEGSREGSLGRAVVGEVIGAGARLGAVDVVHLRTKLLELNAPICRPPRPAAQQSASSVRARGGGWRPGPGWAHR